jgi:hypothetical protein
MALSRPADQEQVITYIALAQPGVPKGRQAVEACRWERGMSGPTNILVQPQCQIQP